MKNIILSVGFALSAIGASLAMAQGLGTITYPIPELGNCQNKEACRTFCEKKENMTACLDYGTKQGLVSKEEASTAKKAIEKIKLGQTPGGCTDRESCSNFCQNNASSLKSCISFAKEMGAPQSDIDEAERVASALEAGAKLPGNCQGKRACEAYCKNVQHIDECLSFAEASGMLPANQIAEAKKIAPFLKSGEMPGGCTDKEACQTYCNDDSHFTECIDFAGKAGLVSKEEADMARKVGGKGPGGCRNKDACEAYCNAPEHADECANFAVEKGLVGEEDAKNIKEGAKRLKDGLESIPKEARPEVQACLNTVFDGKLQAILDGTQMITKAQGDKIQPCFANIGAIMQKVMMQGARKGEQSQPKESSGDTEGMMQRAVETRGAPCNSPEECRALYGGEAGGPPTNIPTGMPSGIPTGIPAGIPSGYPTEIPR